MLVTDALRSLGGCALATELRGMVKRQAIRNAVTEGLVTREGRVYVLAPSPRGAIAATELRGVRSHRTAAEHWGMAVPPGDGRTHVTIPRKARRRGVPSDVQLHYRDYRPAQVVDGVTDPVTTVVDCLRDEPLTVALSVGDSALRQQFTEWRELDRAVRRLRGPGSRVARERSGLLDARAANAFESCARAILIEARITGFEPQVGIRHDGRWIGRVDLADRRRRIAVECDDFETHGGRQAFVADLLRHTRLTCAGWRSLRFTWEQVMFEPEWVAERVREVVELVDREAA